MKSAVFNGLIMILVVAAAYLAIRQLPARAALPPASVVLSYQPVDLAVAAAPLRLAGAWQLKVADRRFGGISSLTIDRGRFLAVSDRGSVARFDPPGAQNPQAWVADLRDGPGPWGRKWARDAESLVEDPHGRGWWVGFEQHHSLWLYDRGFRSALATIDLDRPDWWNNRGAEGLLAEDGRLLVIGENGREAMRIESNQVERVPLQVGADLAEAATAPDGSSWLLLRSKGWQGISQSIAPLLRVGSGYRAGPGMPLPKGMFDNYEGMAIEPRPGGGWRFWLISDDGHRIMARTLLVALDYVPPVKHDESPAIAGLSKEPSVRKP
ncbi:MAG: esterase-like activity of phytase family protein [Pseudomonadota bacterium]|nr:esterase-like activity of phytase family protein [Pseudomonadota bacterium]